MQYRFSKKLSHLKLCLTFAKCDANIEVIFFTFDDIPFQLTFDVTANVTKFN